MRTSLGRANPLIAAIILQIACHADITTPHYDPPPIVPEGAIALNIDVSRAIVSQLVSTTTTVQPATAWTLGSGVRANISNVVRSSPVFGRVRVTFDLALTNTFANIDLVPSTFPAPPTAQVVAYPFSTNPAGLFGLKVIPTSDWDGNPWNFFNDPVCVALTPPSDCYRWEPFGPSIAAGATTAPRRVGFDVDASIASFTVYIAVAADHQERATTPQAPIMSLSELNPIFTWMIGSAGPESRAVHLTNIGGGTITGLATTISYESGATGWLEVALSSTSAPATITVQPLATGLQPGTYLARMAITSATATNSPQSATVALIITAPAVGLSSNHAEFRAGYLGPALTQTIGITSAGPSQLNDLELSLVGADTRWLHATLNSTTTPATLTLVADPGDLAPLFNTYIAEVHVTAPGGASAIVVVTMNVSLLPDLTFVGTPTITTAPGSVTVSNLTVANQGYLNAGSFNVAICVSPTPSPSDCIAEAFVTRTGLFSLSTDVLPPLTIPSTPPTPLPPGTYYLFAIVDPPFTAMVEESYETNNISSLGAIVIPP